MTTRSRKKGRVTLDDLTAASKAAVVASGRKRLIPKATNELALATVLFDREEIDEMLANPVITPESRALLELELQRRASGNAIHVNKATGTLTEVKPTRSRKPAASRELPSGFGPDTPFDDVGTIYEGDIPATVQKKAEKVLPVSGERRRCIDDLITSSEGRGLTYGQVLKAYRDCIEGPEPEPAATAAGLQPAEVLIHRMRRTLDELEQQYPSDIRIPQAARDTPAISSPSDAADLLRPTVGHLPQEQLRVLWLNSRNQVVGQHMVHQGTINSSPVAVADVFRPALRAGAVSIIIAHNHPTGDPTPSREDIEVTRPIIRAGKDLGIEVLDHVVIGNNGTYTSIKAKDIGGVFSGGGVLERQAQYNAEESNMATIAERRKSYSASAPPDWYPVESIGLDSLQVRPRLFQGREGTGGKHYDEAAVMRLADTFDRKAFTPVVVVKDSRKPGQFIIIEGHHRLALMEEMQRRDPKGGYDLVPSVVLEGNPYTEAGRAKLRQTALESNYRVKSTNFREDAKAAHALRTEGAGMTVEQVAQRLRKKPSEVRGLVAAASLPPTILDRVVVQPELEGAAIALGRGKTAYGMSDEAVDAMFRSLLDEYEKTGNPPGERLVSGRLKQLQERVSQGEQGGFGGFEGFNADVDLAAWIEQGNEAEELRRQRLQMGKQLTSCQRLARELGVDISTVKELAQTRLDELDAEQEARVREALAAHREENEPPPPPPAKPSAIPRSRKGKKTETAAAIMRDPDTGEEVALTATKEGDGPVVVHAQGKPGPLMDATEMALQDVAGQATLGDDFATNQTLAMPVAVRATEPPGPLIDPEPLRAQGQRRQAIEDGQIEINIDVDVDAKPARQTRKPTKPKVAKPKTKATAKPRQAHPFLSKREATTKTTRRRSKAK